MLRLGMRGLLDKMERAVENGDPVLLENIGESVDAVLGPIIARLGVGVGVRLGLGLLGVGVGLGLLGLGLGFLGLLG